MTVADEKTYVNAAELLNKQLNGRSIVETAHSPAVPILTILREVKNVSVTVPKGCKLITTREPNYWFSGMVLDTLEDSDIAQYLNRHYYVATSDIGHKICASVRVMEKTMPDGRVFHHLDILATPGEKSETSLKIIKNSKEAGFELTQSPKWKVIFRPIE